MTLTFEQIFRGRWVLEHAIRHIANRAAKSAQLGLFIPSTHEAEREAYEILNDARAQLEREFQAKRRRRAARQIAKPAQRRRTV
ncbi:MAG TPA: hypothetical protein VFB79_18725 [Candidatus Angelobacter sp.]|nr:hypothetical protein [Candidatus Angelobacter sp.]